MTLIYKGRETAVRIDKETAVRVTALREKGIAPCLAVVRVGERPDDLAYESGLMKRASELAVNVRRVLLPTDVRQDAVERVIDDLNADEAVHGILVFCPLPAHLNERAVCERIAPDKDVDGTTAMSAAGVFLGKPIGYPPCTADAVVRILEDRQVPLRGRKVCVVGRSNVVGKPLSLMLIGKSATVTVCHSATADLPAETLAADIIVSCAGRAGLIGRRHVRPGQVVIDVGINFDEDGRMCGDAAAEEIDGIAGAMTPVTGGVVSVTISVLMSHVAEAAGRKNL